MSAPTALHTLVTEFAARREEMLGGRYNETQLRRDFLDPLFGLLGWNVGNAGPRSRSQALRDVVLEAAVVVDGRTRFPDYAFRVGGREAFFAEAKKPSVNLDRDRDPAFQARSYGWSAKHPLAALTDFEEFALYDTRVPPRPGDDAAERRLMYLRFEEYPDRWGELAAVLSREAVVDGRFAAYAAALPGGRKARAREVDDAFLADIERWRERLAVDLAARNPGLSAPDLNFAVQVTIDRVVFLRICEDRGLETHGTLVGLLGDGAYQRLLGRFEEADAKYNSGLFHFRKERDRPGGPDDLTPRLDVGDDVLEAMIGGLYYPDGPYSFAVLPADILGQIYERFLGKVIRRPAGGGAVVEEKPEVRKAGGVYYTPTYIVDYIVGRTVGELLGGAAVTNAARSDRRLDRPLRVLDPACGSGSFLLGAYQYLLDWYREWYAGHDPEALAGAKNPPIRQTAGGRGWALTTAERKRILLAHLYGVDIDAQAVEVTKLSLLLKVLEGEPGEAAGPTLFAAGRVLPDLGGNVKCGNSLIGTDFYEHAQGDLFDTEERLRVNAFDWEVEFAEAMSDGGFEAVIGNPPYIRIQTLTEWAPDEVAHIRTVYRSAETGNFDVYVAFAECGLGMLGTGGLLGFILPHKFLNAKYGAGLRSIINERRAMRSLVHFNDQQVFGGASTYTCLLFLSREANPTIHVTSVKDIDAWRGEGASEVGDVAADDLNAAEWEFIVGDGAELVRTALGSHPTLGDLTERIYQGPITGADDVFLFKDSVLPDRATGTVSVTPKGADEAVELESNILRPVLRSGQIGRFWGKPSATVLFPYDVSGKEAALISEGQMRERFPLAYSYLQTHEGKLRGRERGRFDNEEWYQFSRGQNLARWRSPKVMVPYMVPRLAAYLDESVDVFFINVTTGGYGLGLKSGVDPSSLIAILNSRFLHFVFAKISSNFRGGYFAANKQFIERLPIACNDHPDLAVRAEQMQSLHRDRAAASSPHARTVLDRQIAATDRKIDTLVYELYGLTDAEIAVVEAATAGAG